MDSTAYRYNKAERIIETPGTNYGGKMTRVYKEANVEVWHCTGGTHFAGRGQQEYHASRFYLVHVYRHHYDNPPDGKPTYGDRAVLMLEIEPGTKWRRIQHAMIDVCKAISPLPEQPEHNGQGFTPPRAQNLTATLKKSVLEIAEQYGKSK